MALVGANGAGKSTLVNICAGITQPDQGTVEVEGSIGYCPQVPGLVELLSAKEHLQLASAALAEPAAGIRRGEELLDALHFDVADKTVSKELSGGERQKLNLAMSLVADPSVLLLDEPYQGFDHGTYVNLWDLIARWTTEGRSVLVITHLLAERNRVGIVCDLVDGVLQEPAP